MFMLGYDYGFLYNYAIKVPISTSINSHLIVVGGSGSGKSTAILYWIYKIKKSDYKIDLYIADFKKSNDFVGISNNFGEFEESYFVIKQFYTNFLSTPEGGDGFIKILLIDEIAGLLMHFSMTKDGKSKAEEIKSIMSNILMLGRSRKCFLWLSMQRYTANIFPSASGSADNFHVCIGLGRLSPDSRKGLFAGEHFKGEEDLSFTQSKGIVLINGQSLRALIIPTISKTKLLKLLQKN